jgi:hypothetical protein
MEHVVDQGNAIFGNTLERCDLQYFAAPALWRVGRETAPIGGESVPSSRNSWYEFELYFDV